MDTWVTAIAGLGIGFGASAILFMRVVVAKLEALLASNRETATKLLDFNRGAAADLKEYQESGVQKVEEQNMHAVLKRLTDLELRVRGENLEPDDGVH